MFERKFGDQQHPKYVPKELLEKKHLRMLTVFNTIDGSTKFQVIVFKPNSQTILAAECICLCKLCKVAYCSCTLFKEYCLNVKLLKQTSVRSSVKKFEKNTTQSNSSSHGFLLPGSICAIAAEKKPPNTIDKVAGKDAINYYRYQIPEGIQFICGRYLEKVAKAKKGKKI